MPAEKAHRVSLVKRTRNKAVRSRVKTVVRQARDSLGRADHAQGQQTVVQAIKVLDQAAGKGAVHPNSAARTKSRLMKKLNQVLAVAAQPKPADTATPAAKASKTGRRKRQSAPRKSASSSRSATSGPAASPR